MGVVEALDKGFYNSKMNSLKRTINEINGYFSRYTNEYNKSRNDDFFKKETDKLRKEVSDLIKSGSVKDEDEALERILPKAYGLVKLAVQKKLGLTYYDVQLMGGILLNEGYISEMATGEGKTITAILPTYLNAIMGHGAHVITPNDYLAKRDHDELEPVFNLLGLSCGLATNKGRGRVASYIEEAQAQEKAFKEIDELPISPKEKSIRKAEYKKNQKHGKTNKDAYACDVTYGSARVLAVDYLNDTLNDNAESRMTRFGEPNFVVIDEADEVLFDDALNSYIISGHQSDEDLGISEEDRKKINYSIKKFAEVIDFVNKNGLVYETKDYNEHTHIPDKEHTHAIYWSSSPSGYVASPILDSVCYSIFKKEELAKILNRNKAEVLRNVNPGEYYYEDGNLCLKPMALYRLITDNQAVSELQRSYDKFINDELLRDQLRNAITAWFLLNEGKDYLLSPGDNPNEKKVLLVGSNGRTEEGQAYSNGLQEAVEEKERYKAKQAGKNYTVAPTPSTDELAAISVASFYFRYKKFSGMTGTSCREAFEELYGRETYKVPTNKPRNVTDLGERLLPTIDGKNATILEEVMKAHKKGQPVLISTTSVEESKRLKEYLDKHMSINETSNTSPARTILPPILFGKLPSMGVKKSSNETKESSTGIQLLNAETASLEEEARIIAAAGKKGAITISTEMAGRGTDIKLTDEVKSLGGLKVICSGHFKYDRVDRQVVGRTGRQGNKGEYIFINDLDDLKMLGVSEDELDKLAILASYTDRDVSKDQVYVKAVRKAQAINESLTESGIKYEHMFERPASICRDFFVRKKEGLLQTGDYKKFLIDSLDYLNKYIISECSKNDSDYIGNGVKIISDFDFKLNSIPLNIDKLKDEFRSTYGKELDDSIIDECKTVSDLTRAMSEVGKRVLQKCDVDKKTVDKHLKRAWTYFKNGVSSVKDQYSASALTGAGDILKNYEEAVIDTFMEIYHDEIKDTVKETTGHKQVYTSNPVFVSNPLFPSLGRQR